ncbi:OB-fold domain-containing protein [Nocardia gipuzkoensis]|uniref:OB-fold domain-containing protein n=1 Tax=Nocardia gipuzkoensis TaxID=2749991 RepID=UPI00237D864C|nr:OB-fold domain-containing protein [Nocardia gipuzkoensis]MDE1675263.1 OB-fold domain-containing protein [Nocardia gipuzkoensis]
MNFPTPTGIVAAGAYLPFYRLERAALSGAKARGHRTVASYDEDTTSMGVEAGRRALSDYTGPPIRQLLFATSMPAYADKTNATAVHAALGLSRSCGAYDMVGAVRCGIGAYRAASAAAMAGTTTMAVFSDIRTGLPGSVDERTGGDGAASIVWASEGPFLAELVGCSATSAEFLDRWRVPGEPRSRVWEERFGEAIYTTVAELALADALKEFGVVPDDIDHFIVTGTHPRAVNAIARRSGIKADRVVDDRSSTVGNTGTSHSALLLIDVLERAQPGELIALLVLADGADCLLLRAGDALATRRPAPTVSSQLAGKPVAYQDFLVWRDMLRMEPPRRPDPDRPASPPSQRNTMWKFGFFVACCANCGTRHLPPARVCLRCHAVDQMESEPLSDIQGTITTFAVDNLAFSVAPPAVAAVVDFYGGGRLQCQLTDCDPDVVQVGDRVKLTFRRLYTTADGVHNYFWKARPMRDEEDRSP